MFPLRNALSLLHTRNNPFQGELKHQKWSRIESEFLSPVDTSPHGDKIVSMGDIIMIKNMSMSTNVSVFSDNKIHYSITGDTLNPSYHY